MSEVRLIDAKALGIGKCNPDIFPPHYGDGWNAAINIIEQAPTVPAVPLADHERMKRELHSKITLLKKQIAEVTAERDKSGKWLVTEAYPHRVFCSECFKTNVPNEEYLFERNEYPKYCMWCGAKMDKATPQRAYLVGDANCGRDKNGVLRGSIKAVVLDEELILNDFMKGVE